MLKLSRYSDGCSTSPQFHRRKVSPKWCFLLFFPSLLLFMLALHSIKKNNNSKCMQSYEEFFLTTQPTAILWRVFSYNPSNPWNWVILGGFFFSSNTPTPPGKSPRHSRIPKTSSCRSTSKVGNPSWTWNCLGGWIWSKNWSFVWLTMCLFFVDRIVKDDVFDLICFLDCQGWLVRILLFNCRFELYMKLRCVKTYKVKRMSICCLWALSTQKFDNQRNKPYRWTVLTVMCCQRCFSMYPHVYFITFSPRNRAFFPRLAQNIQIYHTYRNIWK